MPVIDHVVNDFTHGELDPKMLSRPDLEIYNKSAISLQNMLVLPQGGVKKRFGLSYKSEINTTTDYAFQMTYFAYDSDNYYIIIFLPLSVSIYKKDGTFIKDIVTTYTETELLKNALVFTHSKNSLLITNGTTIPTQIIRGNLETDWVISNFNFKIYPSYDFNNIDYSTFTFKLSSANTGSNISLTSDNDIFNSDYVDGAFISLGDTSTDEIGTARITSVTDAKNAKVTVLQAFTGSITTSGVIGADCVVKENIYTPDNGYPSCCSFFENRLVFGGTEKLPSLIAESKPAQYNNFDTGIGNPADAIVDILQTDGLSATRYVVGDQVLEIFTTDSEHVGTMSVDTDSSANSTSFHVQTHEGISNVAPVQLDNQVFFVAKNGKKIQNFIFDENSRSYQSQNVSIYSPHLINNPVAMTALKNNPNIEGDWLLIVNSDGTMIAYQSIVAQQVSAFTPLVTDGEFQDVILVDNEVYCIVKRTINDGDHFYLEHVNFNSFTDSNYINTYSIPTDTITGLNHLEGKTVDVKADDLIYQDLVVESGSIVLEREISEVEVGLHFTPLVIPNPPQPTTQTGSAFFDIKSIPIIYVYYYESIGIKINGVTIPYRKFGEHAFDVPQPTTDIYEFTNLEDSAYQPIVTFTQTLPYPMTILSVGMKVEIE